MELSLEALDFLPKDQRRTAYSRHFPLYNVLSIVKRVQQHLGLLASLYSLILKLLKYKDVFPHLRLVYLILGDSEVQSIVTYYMVYPLVNL